MANLNPTVQGWFDKYATGFSPNQEGTDFWNQQFQTLGEQGAFNKFLNPQNMQAGRNPYMVVDPDYQSYRASQTVTPQPTPSTSSNYLTLNDLNNWWNQQKNTTQTTQTPSSGSPGTSLGTLYPRQNWGNYQTSNRGARYFDQGTGNYSLSNLSF